MKSFAIPRLVIVVVVMSVTDDRRKLVQNLRTLAAEYDVARVKDTASKDRVKEMVDAIREEALSEADLASLDEWWEAYRGSWPGWLSVAEPEDEGVGVRWGFKAGQLTYNSTKGDWATSDPTVLHNLFMRLVAFIRSVLVPYSPQGTSLTLEESLHSSPRHVHAHVYMHLSKEYRNRSLDLFAFEGLRPHFESNRGRGKAYDGAVRRGHYYVVVPKIGTLFEWTDYHPFRDYAVEGWWIDNWLKAGKLSRATYLQISAKITIGFQKRLVDVRAAERYEKESAVQQHVEQELLLLGELQPAKSYPEVDLFVSYFTGEPRRRRPILAIIGGTNLGKSLLALQILKQICEAVGVLSYLEITVEGNEFLDFSEYDHRVHGGVLLDGVGDALLLKKNRELLQGRPKVARGGQSGTMIYSYPFTLCKRAVIATFDLAAANLKALQHDHWLSNPLNVIVLKLTEPAYHVHGLASMSTPGSPRRPPAKRRMPLSKAVPVLPPLV